MKGKPWYVWLGKLAPWAAAAVTAFVKEVLGIEISWLPTALTLGLGIVQLIISFVQPVVIRHNTIDGTNFGFHGCDSGDLRGVHSFEVYDNAFTTDYVLGSAWFRTRGGTKDPA